MLRRKNSQAWWESGENEESAQRRRLRMRIPMISNIKRMMKKWKQEQLNNRGKIFPVNPSANE